MDACELPELHFECSPACIIFRSERPEHTRNGSMCLSQIMVFAVADLIYKYGTTHTTEFIK